MTAIKYLLALVVIGQATAEVVDLSCSDNATCIDNLTKEFVRNLRQKKTVRLFDTLTVEPLSRARQARSYQSPLTRFLEGHAFSLDVSDYSFRLSKSEQPNDAVELEVFEGRSTKDVAEKVPKKSISSSSKVEDDDEEEEKLPKRLRRRQRKKVMQALLPMFFGMKSAAVVIFSMAVVTALTMKAFVASKLALAVTVGMALKRLYENYGSGVGLTNQPYLYSQYPIDFPSASSHTYSVSGVNPSFASQEMYNPTALASPTHTHEMLQQSDVTAQQSQQAPTVQLLNSTRASERWDGKSSLLRFLEPLISGIRSFVDPIASVFFNAMPATFRGMTSDVTKAKSQQFDEPIESASTIVEEKVKKPKEILVPQPRNIAQRKTTNTRKRGLGNGPTKKYADLKVDLDKLKRNKDFQDYIKTKKYKHNYPYTSYYPRVKHFMNPNNFPVKLNRSRLVSYKKDPSFVNSFKFSNETSRLESVYSLNNSDWKPIITIDTIAPVNVTFNVSNVHKRNKRQLHFIDRNSSPYRNSSIQNALKSNSQPRGLIETGRSILDFLELLFESEPVQGFIAEAGIYAKNAFKKSILKEKHTPPKYYLLTYDMLMFSLAVLEDFAHMQKAIYDHMLGGTKRIRHKKPTEELSKKSKPLKPGKSVVNVTKSSKSKQKVDKGKLKVKV